MSFKTSDTVKKKAYLIYIFQNSYQKFAFLKNITLVINITMDKTQHLDDTFV